MSIRLRFHSARALVRPDYMAAESRRATATRPRTRSLLSDYRGRLKGRAVQHQNATKGTFATKNPAEPAPGKAQTSAASRIDADIEAIRELQQRIGYLWGNLAAPFREDLSARLDLLATAADHRATDSRPVREALQEVLLSIGTGALAALSEPTRRRLAALTGIALPGLREPGPRATTRTRPSGTGLPDNQLLIQDDEMQRKGRRMGFFEDLREMQKNATGKTAGAIAAILSLPPPQ
jgi:hypothetical protein